MNGAPPRTFFWPYFLLAAMTFVTFGGPFLVLVVVQGGTSPNWPPDRAVEWITIVAVLGLFVALFVGCITVSRWYPRLRHRKAPRGR